MKKWITFGEIYLNIQTNAFLYYCRLLPFVKHFVGPHWYGRYGLKHIFSVFGVILGFVKEALGSNLGVLVRVYWLPSLIAPDFNPGAWEYFFLFLGVECLTSLIDSCTIFNSKAEDYTFLYHFMVNPRMYYLYKELKYIFFSSLMLFPVLLFLLKNVYMVVAAIGLSVVCKLLGNVFYLSYYNRKKKLVNKKMRRLLSLSVYVSVYVFLIWFRVPVTNLGEEVLFVVTATSVAIGYFCWRFHKRFGGYKEIATRFGNQSAVSFRVTVRSVGEDERGLEERPWEENKAFYERSQRLEATEYLHRAFWERFGKLIYKDIFVQAVSMCILLSGLGIGVRMGWIPFDTTDILSYSPILLSMTMSFSFASRITQMYFRNIDLHLLFNRMATETFIKNSMRKRYLHIIGVDIAYIGITLVAMLLFFIAGGVSVSGIVIFQLLAVSGSFLILLDTYQVMLYYFVQPYTADLAVKSPVFSFLQIFESLTGVLILFVRHDITSGLSIAVTMASAAVLICIYSGKYAHWFFKLRH